MISTVSAIHAHTIALHRIEIAREQEILRMHATHNTLPEIIRGQSIELLNKHLAAAIDLHAQMKQAHWNVRGPSFISIHELFDKVSAEVEEFSDQIAERAGGLGGTAYGTVQMAAERSFLIPYPLGIADETQHIFAVSSALAAFGQSAREAIKLADDFGDADTADLFTQISRGIDQQLWFVEAHIDPQKKHQQVITDLRLVNATPKDSKVK
jgi:starvation-inducible DNA-binding protein